MHGGILYGRVIPRPQLYFCRFGQTLKWRPKAPRLTTEYGHTVQPTASLVQAGQFPDDFCVQLNDVHPVTDSRVRCYRIDDRDLPLGQCGQIW